MLINSAGYVIFHLLSEVSSLNNYVSNILAITSNEIWSEKLEEMLYYDYSQILLIGRHI